MTTRLTSTGIARNGRVVVDLAETDAGLRIDAATVLSIAERRHLARLLNESATNAERVAAVDRGLYRAVDLPAAVSPWG